MIKKFVFGLVLCVFSFSAFADTINEPASIAVTTASTPVLASNPKRGDVWVVNYGTVGCFLCRKTTATVGKGIYLAPNGIGVYTCSLDNDLYKGVLSAITATGATTLTVSEKAP